MALLSPQDRHPDRPGKIASGRRGVLRRLCPHIRADDGDGPETRHPRNAHLGLPRPSGFPGLAPRTRSDYQGVFEYLRPIADTALVKFDRPLVVRIPDKAAAPVGANSPMT